MAILGNRHARGKGKAQMFVKELLSKTPEELGDDCILWPFNLTRNGYGRLMVEGVTHTHHRAMWIIKHGPITEGLVVRHKCLNRHCANPNHHELGTSQENALDKQRDGTQTRGHDIPCSRLTEAQVIELYTQVKEGGNQRDIAKAFGISTFAVNAIIKGKTWKHLKLEPLKGDYRPRGSEKPLSKLDELKVRDIHARFAKGESKRKLAKEYNISYGTVSHIVKGRSWKHLNLEVIIR